MTSPAIDPAFTVTRLQICAYLSGCDQADYTAVQQYCGLSKPTLSKSLTLLDERRYVEIRKVQSGRYAKTTLRLTDTGRDALAQHLNALRDIATQAVQRRRARRVRADPSADDLNARFRRAARGPAVAEQFQQPETASSQ